MTTPPTSGSARPAGRRARRLVAVLAAVMAALTFMPAVAGPAAADDFGLTTNFGNVPDVGSIPEDWIHDYCYDFNTSTYDGALASYYLWVGYYNVMYETYYTERYAGRCTADTDVVFRLDHNLDAFGQASCWRWSPDGATCRSSIVMINPTRIGLNNTHHLAKTACHEVGHTIGLADGSLNNPNGWWNDCMHSGVPPAGAQFETINRHHVDHANSRRPFDDPFDN